MLLPKPAVAGLRALSIVVSQSSSPWRVDEAKKAMASHFRPSTRPTPWPGKTVARAQAGKARWGRPRRHQTPDSEDLCRRRDLATLWPSTSSRRPSIHPRPSIEFDVKDVFALQRRPSRQKVKLPCSVRRALPRPVLYRTRHFLRWLLLRLLRDRSAARVAFSNTSRTPSLVLAEHSRYLCAPIFLRTSSPYIANTTR